MQERDLYADLGVARDAPAEVIRSAYRKLARQFHPDVNPNDPKAEDRFKEISYAWDVLSDEEKRRRYDEFGTAGLAEGFDPEQARAYQRWSRGTRRSPHFESFSSDVDLEDLLSGFFGGQRSSRPSKGSDLEAPVDVEFIDAVRGGEVRVGVPGQPALRVRIPPGAEDGTRVRLAGKGQEGALGGPPGDLYLKLRVRPHPFFTREGADLRVEIPITVPEAILGAKVEVPTPDGPVTLTVPPRSRSGQTLRLRGKGASRRTGGRGDLYARLSVELPEGDDPRVEELARDFEPLYEGRSVRKRFEGNE
jgi:DnaJ-class molecular chaperone